MIWGAHPYFWKHPYADLVSMKIFSGSFMDESCGLKQEPVGDLPRFHPETRPLEKEIPIGHHHF